MIKKGKKNIVFIKNYVDENNPHDDNSHSHAILCSEECVFWLELPILLRITKSFHSILSFLKPVKGHFRLQIFFVGDSAPMTRFVGQKGAQSTHHQHHLFCGLDSFR